MLCTGQKQKKIPINYSDRELVGDFLITALCWDQQRRQQLVAVDVESLTVTSLNLTTLLPQLFPPLESEPVAIFYDYREDKQIVSIAASFDRDIIVRLSPKFDPPTTQ